MLFDAPVDILDMQKCSISSATRRFSRSASRTLLDATASMKSALSDSRPTLTPESSTPKQCTPQPRPAPFRRYFSSPQLLASKKSLSPQSSSTPVDDSTPKAATLPRNSVNMALAQRMKMLSDLSLSLTNLER